MSPTHIKAQGQDEAIEEVVLGARLTYQGPQAHLLPSVDVGHTLERHPRKVGYDQNPAVDRDPQIFAELQEHVVHGTVLVRARRELVA